MKPQTKEMLTKTETQKPTAEEIRIAALKANAAKITANLAARAKAHNEANH